MNERIKDLAHVLPFAWIEKSPVNIEKFAELIVNECFKKLMPYLDDQFINDIEAELKDHFGIVS